MRISLYSLLLSIFLVNCEDFCRIYPKNFPEIPMVYKFTHDRFYLIYKGIEWEIVLINNKIQFDANNGKATKIEIGDYQIGERERFCSIINPFFVEQSQVTILYQQATNSTKLIRIEENSAGQLYQIIDEDLKKAAELQGLSPNLSDSQRLARLGLLQNDEHGDACGDFTVKKVFEATEHQEEQLREKMHKKWNNSIFTSNSNITIVFPVPPITNFDRVKYWCFQFLPEQVFASISSEPNCIIEQEPINLCSKVTHKPTDQATDKLDQAITSMTSNTESPIDEMNSKFSFVLNVMFPFIILIFVMVLFIFYKMFRRQIMNRISKLSKQFHITRANRHSHRPVSQTTTV